MFLEVVVLIILVEALTNLISKSDIFKPIRKYCFDSNNKLLSFMHDLLECPYCVSVWVAMFVVGLYELYINNLLPPILMLFFMVIVLHRLSNILHFIIDRVDSNHTLFIGNGSNILEEETEDERLY